VHNDEFDQRVLFGLLTEPRYQPISANDMCAELGWPQERLDRALQRLADDGLARRDGDYAGATRAAVRGGELLL
jgi:predicted transcriptional regulator